MNKSHLSESDRKVIETMLKAKTSQSQIGKVNERYFICMEGVGFDAYILKKNQIPNGKKSTEL